MHGGKQNTTVINGDKVGNTVIFGPLFPANPLEYYLGRIGAILIS